MHFFGRIRKQICDLISFGSCRIKGTDESTLDTDPSVPLMRHNPNDLRPQIRFQILRPPPPPQKKIIIIIKNRTLCKVSTSFCCNNIIGNNSDLEGGGIYFASILHRLRVSHTHNTDGRLPVGLIAQFFIALHGTAPVSQRSWVRIL